MNNYSTIYKRTQIKLNQLGVTILAVILVVGLIRPAYAAKAVPGKLVCNNSPSISLAGKSWTMAAWYYLPVGGTLLRLASKSAVDASGAGNEVGALANWYGDNFIDNQGVAAYFGLRGDRADFDGMGQGSWHLVTESYDFPTQRGYLRIDLNAEIAEDNPIAIDPTTSPLWIDNAQPLFVDSLGIWNRRLDPNLEQPQLYNNGAGWNLASLPVNLRPGVTAWWDFEENSGQPRVDGVSGNIFQEVGGPVGFTPGLVGRAARMGGPVAHGGHG